MEGRGVKQQREGDRTKKREGEGRNPGMIQEKTFHLILTSSTVIRDLVPAVGDVTSSQRRRVACAVHERVRRVHAAGHLLKEACCTDKVS